MPIYEYRCNKCQHQYETFQEITSRPLKKCPKCKQRGLERLLFAATGFVRQEPKTLAQLAERNTKKAGSRHVEAEAAKTKDNNIRELKKLAKMSEEQKTKFIEGN